MYKGCCCYCESKIKSTSYLEIEHFKPKSKYKELCFDYSCKRCNLAKESYYTDNLLNPSEDNPEEYIRYIGELAVSIDNNERGKETINVVKLNERSEEIVNERLTGVVKNLANKLSIG